jgi:hypothetical protein
MRHALYLNLTISSVLIPSSSLDIALPRNYKLVSA